MNSSIFSELNKKYILKQKQYWCSLQKLQKYDSLTIESRLVITDMDEESQIYLSRPSEVQR